jgi:hypothetical protein
LLTPTDRHIAQLDEAPRDEALDEIPDGERLLVELRFGRQGERFGDGFGEGEEGHGRPRGWRFGEGGRGDDGSEGVVVGEVGEPLDETVEVLGRAVVAGEREAEGRPLSSLNKRAKGQDQLALSIPHRKLVARCRLTL